MRLEVLLVVRIPEVFVARIARTDVACAALASTRSPSRTARAFASARTKLRQDRQPGMNANPLKPTDAERKQRPPIAAATPTTPEFEQRGKRALAVAGPPRSETGIPTLPEMLPRNARLPDRSGVPTREPIPRERLRHPRELESPRSSIRGEAEARDQERVVAWCCGWVVRGVVRSRGLSWSAGSPLRC
jgi:hypothetical protein